MISFGSSSLGKQSLSSSRSATSFAIASRVTVPLRTTWAEQSRDRRRRSSTASISNPPHLAPDGYIRRNTEKFDGLCGTLGRGIAKTTLSEFVRRALAEKRYSLREVERCSRGRISAGYISDLARCKATNPGVQKLAALALALGVSEEELDRAAAGRPAPQRDELEARLLAYFRALPEGRRRDLLALAEIFYEAATWPDPGRRAGAARAAGQAGAPFMR